MIAGERLEFTSSTFVIQFCRDWNFILESRELNICCINFHLSVMKNRFADLTFTLCVVWSLLLPVPLSNATTSWHAYDADLIKSKSSLDECLIYENSTRPQRQDSKSRKHQKAQSSDRMGLWQGKRKRFLLMSNFRQGIWASLFWIASCQLNQQSSEEDWVTLHKFWPILRIYFTCYIFLANSSVITSRYEYGGIFVRI